MRLRKILSVDIPMHPRGKQRARSRAGSASHYTPKMTVNNEAHMMMMAAQQMAGQEPAQGVVKLDVKIFLSPSAVLRKKIIKEPENKMIWYPLKKPDIDNVQKSVMDSLNGIAWLDDKQVCEVCENKRYTLQAPMTQITAWEIMEGDEDE